MKSDRKIQQEVIDGIQSEPALNTAEISVAVTRGAVTLRGNVFSLVQKNLAICAAKCVNDVKAIALDLHVQPLPGEKTDDTDIAASIVDILTWDTSLCDEHIRAIVDNGRVILEGEVRDQSKKEAVASAVNCIQDIRNISNRIIVKPEPNKLSDNEQRNNTP